MSNSNNKTIIKQHVRWGNIVMNEKAGVNNILKKPNAERFINNNIEDSNISEERFNDKGKVISEEIRIIYIYRYLSWALTSLVYMAYGPKFVFLFKLGVIVSLLISSVIITQLYIKFQQNKKMVMMLVFTESIGIALILFTTGGLESPFMWYALNPIIIAASYLPLYVCWLNLTFYLMLGVYITFRFFNPENIGILQILGENITPLMIFALITTAVQILGGTVRKSKEKSVLLLKQQSELQSVNKELSDLIRQRDDSLSHIMSMYDIMETFNSESQKDDFFDTLAHYASLLTNSDTGFFYIYSEEDALNTIIADRELTEEENLDILDAITQLEQIKEKNSAPRSMKVGEDTLIISKIASASADYGWVGVKLFKEVRSYDEKQTESFLKFLSGLCSARLDRFYFLKIEENMLIMEEQNRIANEIHDSVSQRLFSINYSIHALIKRWESLTKNELWTYLLEFKESSNKAMKELRDSIYGLSTGKRGISALQTNLQSFFDGLSKMHAVNIEFDSEIDENQLSFALKQAVTRIIRESCTNAIRHGKALNIKITLRLENYNLSISVKDDGKGFDPEEARENTGLGLSNIRHLVNTFSGRLEIIAGSDQGCEIRAVMDIH